MSLRQENGPALLMMAQRGCGGNGELGTEGQSSRGLRACSRGRARRPRSAGPRQQAASTFCVTQLATPSEQINNGTFWRHTGKCCWLGRALQVKAQRCDLCGKLAPTPGSVTAEGLRVRGGHEQQSHWPLQHGLSPQWHAGWP